MAIKLTQGMIKSVIAADDPQTNLETAVGLLVDATPPTVQPDQPPTGPFTPYTACATPDIRTPPQFVVPYSQRVLLQPPFKIRLAGEFPAPYPTLGCATIKAEAYLAFDLRFLQEWDLYKQSIGDLSSTMGLAPGELLTLEFLTSQRKTLDKTVMDSKEEMSSSESTTMDKEAINVVRASTETENWHIDSSASVSYAGCSLSVNAGYSHNLTKSSQQTVDHVTETTKKSAQSLKTLHKIEVRGVTEGLIQNRMTRVIKNPYPDRTMTLNVFQLIKHFSVATSLDQVRMAFVIEVSPVPNDGSSPPDFTFDSDFVIGQVDFLQQNLIAQSLIDDLPNALTGALPVPTYARAAAARVAKMALKYLYDDIVIFNFLPGVLVQTGVMNAELQVITDPATNLVANPNFPSTSFDASIGYNQKADYVAHSGLADAIRNKSGASMIFAVLNVFYQAWIDSKDPNTGLTTLADDDVLSFANALAGGISDGWKTYSADDDAVRNLMDNNDFTEVFRRVPGFLAMLAGLLDPIKAEADAEQKALSDQEDAKGSLDRLIKHLNCNANYYLQQYLIYMKQQTNTQSLIDFANNVIDGLDLSSADIANELKSVFDVQSLILDRQQIILPGFQALNDADTTKLIQLLAGQQDAPTFSPADVTPGVVNVEVPCDGIHLEVAEGACVLANVPQSQTSLSASLQGATLDFSQSSSPTQEQAKKSAKKT